MYTSLLLCYYASFSVRLRDARKRFYQSFILLDTFEVNAAGTPNLEIKKILFASCFINWGKAH